MTDQLATVDGMSPKEIAQATREGRLDALLKGDAPALALAKAKAEFLAVKAEVEPPKPQKVDQGARGGPSRDKQVTAAELATMSTEQIVKATRQGRMADLL